MKETRVFRNSRTWPLSIAVIPALFLLLQIPAPPAAAVGLDTGGTASVACSTPALKSHKMNASTGIYEYRFEGTCSVVHNEKTDTYGYSVDAKWNDLALKKEAVETITSWEEGLLFTTIDYVVSSCPSDPWINDVRCTLKSATKYSGYADLVNPPFPKTAGALSDSQQAAIRAEKNAARAALGVPGVSLPPSKAAPLNQRADLALAMAPRPDYCAKYEPFAAFSTGINQTVSIMISVKNCGGKDWNKGSGSLTPVLASYHWYLASEPASSKPPVWEGRRSDPGPIDAGATKSFRMFLNAPAKGGAYLLRIDMAHEGSGWFSWKGSRWFEIPITIVEPPPPSKVIGAPGGSSPAKALEKRILVPALRGGNK